MPSLAPDLEVPTNAPPDLFLFWPDAFLPSQDLVAPSASLPQEAAASQPVVSVTALSAPAHATPRPLEVAPSTIQNVTAHATTHPFQAAPSLPVAPMHSQGTVVAAPTVQELASRPSTSSQVGVFDKDQDQATVAIEKAPVKRGRTKRPRETESDAQDSNKTLDDEDGSKSTKRTRRLPTHLQEAQYEAPKKGTAPKKGPSNKGTASNQGSRAGAGKNKR